MHNTAVGKHFTQQNLTYPCSFSGLLAANSPQSDKCGPEDPVTTATVLPSPSFTFRMTTRHQVEHYPKPRATSC